MNKDNILQDINPLDIFFKFLNITELPKTNISSPFSQDKNPSFKLYKNSTFKCHSSGKQGDCFQFVADLNNLDCKTQFSEVLNIIATNFKLNNIANNQFLYTAKQLTTLHLNYWKKANWGVTQEVLTKYNVQALDKFQYYNSVKNEVTKIKLFAGVLGFIYPVNNNVEIYIPKQEKTKKFFYNQLKSNDIFGLNQIENKVDNLIISAGKKDCLILNANGFNSVSFRSENHYINKEQINLLKSKCDNLFICYDNDVAGIQQQSKIVDSYGVIPLTLPSHFNDVADYFLQHNKTDFQTNIDTVLKQQQDKNEYKNERTIFHITEEYLSKFYDFRYNEIALEIEYKQKASFDWKPINENSLFLELNKKGIKVNINYLLAILKSDFIPRYNPITTYFNNLPKWDNKTDYIANLCSYVTTKDKEQFIYHFKKWCVRSVKCVFQDGYFNKQAFVLVHKGQSSGKSTFCRFLCPPELNKYIAEDISNDKDARILLCKNFLINLDELAVLSRNEINSLKSYFSKTVINERLPYDRKNTILPRVCSFIGSTNMTSFLNDETGSVRWLCFELIGQINFNYSKEVNINNVWAQALALANSDFDCELSMDDIKLNEKRNNQFSLLSTEQELISKYFSAPTPNEMEFFTATDVMLYLTPLGIRLNKINIGKALGALGFDKVKEPKKQVYGYWLNKLPLFEPLENNHNKQPWDSYA